MAQAAYPSESSHLLANSANGEDSSSPLQQKSACISCPPSRHLCLPSKAAILILLWTFLAGITYHNFVGISAQIIMNATTLKSSLSEYEPLPYAIMALVMMFYPLSGLIADVYCGRLKAVVVGLIFLLSCEILFCLGITIAVMLTVPHGDIIHWLGHDQGILFVALAFLSVFIFIIGLAGYQANFIQLGLDQPFEAPSRYLGLFIHYALWALSLGSLHFLMTFLIAYCIIKVKRSLKIVLVATQVLIPFGLMVLLLISYRKRQWFRREPGYQNPYKNVYDILKFAKRHKHPLRRSAFTHCDNYIPSRLDFAKERFGGPFTTEQVENVKTFLRILIILFAVGPVFSVEVPSSYFVFPYFGIHFYYYKPILKEYCSSEFIMKLYLETGGLTVLSTVILFPFYVWIVFYLLQKKLPNLLLRLGIGIMLSLLGITSLLITDIAGHAVNHANASNYSLCVFQVAFSHSGSLMHDSLNMHWAVIIPISLLQGIGPLTVTVTTLEFISAQSPQSMKGLLVGVFFAIRGLFQFLNSIVIIPLSLKQPWASREMIEHPPVTNCGFVYLALTSVTGLIGLILFSLAAKRYKYRKRDEGMFHQHEVEEIYDRYMKQVSTNY